MGVSPDRTVADLVGDRYEITGLIASGGMGSVYRARDTVLDRTIALKVLKAGGDDPDFVARFKTEATNAARLSHPNIVQVYDFGYADGSPYMAMEFVDGQTLREVMNARGALRPDLAARIAANVAAALEHARRAGIVHRDVKPENILITTDGQVKVADFGLSRAFAETKATQAGVLFGTAHYLAPEQVQGAPTDHRADIYALGVLLFEMLTGRTPFAGDTTVVIAYKRVAEDVPSAMSINAEVPRELDIIVARATERDPDARFPTAGVMAEALRAAAPRSDTGDIGSLVHHTTAIPIMGEETIAVHRRVPPQQSRAGRHGRKRARWIVLAVLLAMIAGAVYASTGTLKRVEVPTLTGLSRDAAKAALTAAGLRFDIEDANSPTVRPGLVISQRPDPGIKVRTNTVVTLQVSIGPAVVSVPSVVGKTFTGAESLLEAAGFKVVRIDVFSARPRLTVVAQDPGGLAEAGATVTLRVSKGAQKFAVPNVVGDPVDTATSDLKDAGFKVVVKHAFDDKIPKDHVIAQDPAANALAPKDATITLTVSDGPPLVKVPDLYCMTRKQAQDALAAAGFQIAFAGPGRFVVDQDPAAGAKAPKGSTITAYTGPGTRC